MRGMSAEHWMLVAGFVGVIGMQLATMGDTWEHVMTPSFVGGVFCQLALLLRAMFSEKPTRQPVTKDDD